VKAKLQQFMSGRHGLDDLGRGLNILAMVMLVLGSLLLPQLSSLAMMLVIVGIFRIMSRNVYKRTQENEAYMRLRYKITRWVSSHIQQIKNRKTYRYYRCPSCRQSLRVPKGKGKIAVTCPKCKTVFDKRS